MPASVFPITGRREGSYVLLEAVLPEQSPKANGALLLDPATDRAWLRFTDRFQAGPEEIEYLEALQAHCSQMVSEMGGEAFLQSLEGSLSNLLRIGERQPVEVDAFTRVLDRLFRDHVENVELQPFRTHLPLYSLRAAAGALGEEMQSEAEDWIPAPEGMHLTPDLFVAHVVGRSMEPRIPDGSLNLFRLNPVGSRQGKIVLVQRYGALDETARFTVKRYTSTKVSTGKDSSIDGEWAHARIRLEPLNPEFEAWDVGPEDFAVVAEWIRVIE
jgi:SOS-response transcriptional repressor LexA